MSCLHAYYHLIGLICPWCIWWCAVFWSILLNWLNSCMFILQRIMRKVSRHFLTHYQFNMASNIESLKCLFSFAVYSPSTEQIYVNITSFLYFPKNCLCIKAQCDPNSYKEIDFCREWSPYKSLTYDIHYQITQWYVCLGKNYEKPRQHELSLTGI